MASPVQVEIAIDEALTLRVAELEEVLRQVVYVATHRDQPSPDRLGLIAEIATRVLSNG